MFSPGRQFLSVLCPVWWEFVMLLHHIQMFDASAHCSYYRLLLVQLHHSFVWRFCKCVLLFILLSSSISVSTQQTWQQPAAAVSTVTMLWSAATSYSCNCTDIYMTFQDNSVLSVSYIRLYLIKIYIWLIFCASIGPLLSIESAHPDFLRMCFWMLLLRCFCVAAFAVTWKSTVKTEKKTVQFSEDIQVETIEPEQEPVYIDEVSSLQCALAY